MVVSHDPFSKRNDHRPSFKKQRGSRHLSKEASRHLSDEQEDVRHKVPVQAVGIEPTPDIQARPPNTTTGHHRHRRKSDRHERPVVVEFGPSFDPERDRYLNDLEVESSKPPEYIYWDPELVVSENLRII